MDHDLPELPSGLLDGDPQTRAKWSHNLVSRYDQLRDEAARIRREALGELLAVGTTQAEVARLLDMSRSRVSQLVTSGPSPQRAMLGTGTGGVHIAVGGKPDPDRSGDAGASALMSHEASAAVDRLRDLCSGYGLTITTEVVPPPGLFHANRSNLITIGSPKTLPLVGQFAAADPHVSWRQDAGGSWYLVDTATGEEHRSPADSGQPADLAYIARLPRPDGRGSFLALGGIHAMGTKGAAYWLADQLADLYTQVKTRRFSAVARVEYDPRTRKITATPTLLPARTF